MDSLLLVLIVIGVIMILAGLARMNRKKQQINDDIDHSVLFNKNDKKEPLTEPMPNMEAELATLSSIIVDEKKTETSEIQTKKNQPSMFSLFDKFSAEKNKSSIVAETKTRIEVYKENAPNWVIIFNIVAPEGSCFVGPGLVEVIKKAGFIHGDMNLFHYQAKGLSAFSLASMVKPGTFDLNQLDEFTTPGLSLFIQYPNQCGGGVASFDTLLTTTQNLAKKLGGEVRDEKRSVLTHSAIEHLREKVAAYDLKWRHHH